MQSRTLRCVLLLVAAGCLFPLGAAQAYLSDTAPHTPPQYYSFVPPAKGGTYTDPVFGTEIKRLSNALASPDNADGGNLTWVMNEYSTMSAFNLDRSLFILQQDSYFGLYDGQGNYLRDLPFEVYASSEPRWSRKSASLLYFINGNQLKSYDVSAGTTRVVHAFSEYTEVSGHGESDISFDGDHLVLAGDGRFIFVYEISSDTKGQVFDTGGRPWDSLYITPDNHVTITWIDAGTSRYTGIELFDRNMSFLRQLADAGGHMDVTRDSDGSEVLVWTNSADPTPICDNGIIKIRLSDAHQTCLTTLDWSLGVHISCPDGDGSCIVSTYAPSDPDPSASWPAYTGEIFQVMLDGSEVRRLAHHRSRAFNGYNYMTRASISRDGARLVYSSNYGQQQMSGAPTEYSDAYLMSVPAGTAGSGGGTGGGGTSGGGTGGGGTGSSGATTRTEENGAGVTYTGTWFDNTLSAHSGGSAKLAVDPGSRVKFSFNGTGANWIGYRDEWSGIGRVYVDGTAVQDVDTYASPAQAQAVLYSIDGLPAGAHTLEIEVTGQVGPQSADAWVWVDAFEAVDSSGSTGGTTGGTGGGGTGGTGGTTSGATWTRIEETAPEITYSGAWFPNGLAAHSGGGAALATDKGSRAALRFDGTGVRWIGYRDEWSGIARVYLDGKFVKSVDTYASPAEAQQTLFSIQGLAAGTHTLEVRVTGRQSAKSDGAWIWVDAFDVLGGNALAAGDTTATCTKCVSLAAGPN